MSTIDDQRWNLVRHCQQAGFLRAATTTGVYCRPGCPSPAPKRGDARLFATLSDAEAAGFRACRRCDPKGEQAQITGAVVRDACAHIEQMDSMPSVESLAARAGYAKFHFLRMFCDHVGVTPRSYAESVRARRLHVSLAAGEFAAGAMASAGVDSECGKLPGTTLGALRRRGAGGVIRATLADCPFGRLLVGATEIGICFLGFAEPDDALLGDLRRRFPRATLVLDDSGLAEAVRAVVDFIVEPAVELDLPLSLCGTAFQIHVWNALRRIPLGETRSYAQLAAMIDAPRAVRAVARACATNPVSLVIPCHRAVGSDGSLTGYRWGIPRKRELLRRERACRESTLNAVARENRETATET